MNHKFKQITIILLFGLAMTFTFAACNTPEETAIPDTEVDLQEFMPFVSATGEILPKETALLSVKTGGVVAEVLVSEGDTVKKGDVLIRLEGTEQLQAAVSAAGFELANSQYALDALYEDTDLLAAEA